MSFRLRQRGKDAGKTTSLHFLVPHAASKPSSRRTREAMNADPSMHTKDRAKPSLKTPSVKTSEQGEVLKPAFKSDRGAAAAPCRLLQPTKVSTSWLATWPLQNYPVAGGNIENSSEIVFWERLFVIVSVLPALMSRSSWFAGPSCSEVAMFSLAARITPPLRGNLLGFGQSASAERYPSAALHRKSLQRSTSSTNSHRERGIWRCMIRSKVKQLSASDKWSGNHHF